MLLTEPKSGHSQTTPAKFISQSYAIADGFATFLNGYDNQIYSVGRGSSATTVTAPDAGLPSGNP